MSIKLNAIHDVNRYIKNKIKYGRDIPTPEIVINSLRSQDLELKSEKKTGNSKNMLLRVGS